MLNILILLFHKEYISTCTESQGKKMKEFGR